MKIALDLDGVCYEWDKTARYMLRRRLTQQRRPIPTELFAESKHWNTIQEAVEPDDWAWLWSEGVELGLFRYGHCVRGSIEGVQELARIAEVHLLTARPTSLKARRDTNAWVNFMFDMADIRGLHFEEVKTKFPANIYIDDAPGTVRSLATQEKRVILFRRPWNDEVPTSIGVHVHNWPGVVDTVKSFL